MFKFKRENNKFRWESDFMVLEFSNPLIDGYSDFLYIKNEKEILYYDYTVKIYKKINIVQDNSTNITKWKLVGENQVTDFPNILQLKSMLNFQLQDDTTIDGQKQEYKKDNIIYSKTINSEGFACEDFYEIKKEVNINDKSERYIFYCGTSFDAHCNLDTNGIRTSYISKKDIEVLLECVTEFINYSIENKNKYIDDLKERHIIKNKKIYVYEDCNKEIINSIYNIGDIIDVVTVIDNVEEEIYKKKILKIKKESIILENGIKININNIVYSFNQVITEKLYYNQNQVAEDFLMILNKEEKKEFKNTEINILLNKYKAAIVNRTWLCREEHEINTEFKTDDCGDKYELLTPVVKNIIKIIKDKI